MVNTYSKLLIGSSNRQVAPRWIDLPFTEDEFNEMLLISRGYSKAFRYPTIKRWFLLKYPEFAEFGRKPAEDHKVNVFDIHSGNAADDLKTAS